jgi:two-component system chemotaxis response regulator CheY
MKAKVLFADDSPSVRLLIKGVLQSRDFDLIECEDGQVAIDYLRDHTVDLIITDLFMPIVMVTTEGQGERKREGRKAGATAWIVKPFDAQLLLKVVDKCLKIK